MKRCVMNKESSCAAESGKKARIRSMFDRIAPSYDRLNHLLPKPFRSLSKLTA